MYDESARGWCPDQGYARTYDALAGKQNMVRAAVIDAKRLSTRIPIPLLSGDPTRIGLNPSVAISPGGEMIVCLRTLPSSGTSGASGTPGTTSGRTINKLGRIDGGRLVDLKNIGESTLGTSSVFGVEDVRLFFKGEDLWGIATVTKAVQSVGVLKADMIVFKISSSGDISDEQLLKSPRYERNWMPVIGSVSQTYVYSTDPLIIINEGDDVSGLKTPGGTLRGGSQVVPFGGGYLAVVHEVAGGGGAVVEYTHRFVVFDIGLSAARIGKPFFFQKRGIEFCTGLAVKDDSVWISYGVEDKRAFLAEVPEDTMKEFLP